MASPTRPEKRRSSIDSDSSLDEPLSKRQRTTVVKPPTPAPPPRPIAGYSDMSSFALQKELSERPNADSMGRDGLRRSIALALEHVGFDAATPEALESFANDAETYLMTFIADLKTYAEASRRHDPTPTDFEKVLRQHNLGISYLQPHLVNPVLKKKKEKLNAQFYDPTPTSKETDYFKIRSTDFLGPELDGDEERQEKRWIPQTLPSFPPKHTYRFTEAEPTIPDPEKKRVQAAAEARKSEEALRHMERASKQSIHKETAEKAKRYKYSKERHENWEATMKAFLPASGTGTGTQEVADHSIVVDYNASFMRRDVPKVSSRGPLDTLTSRG
ncbi:bromodomain associated protein [Apiospora saccharicola]|uniref:Transcription initiation factor TFIID subunit 8 n=1 Tax=Apiospora saccharicola TaxID=335842 RepID=A0ABR1U592_9PEZI